jgi:integrase
MLALAYDAALRRDEPCSLRTDDVDPTHRTLRIRAETTKNRLERVVPHSASTGVLLADYLTHRATINRARGLLFLSESRRNCAQRLSLPASSTVTTRPWGKAREAVGHQAPHTQGHCCDPSSGNRLTGAHNAAAREHLVCSRAAAIQAQSSDGVRTDALRTRESEQNLSDRRRGSARPKVRSDSVE